MTMAPITIPTATSEPSCLIPGRLEKFRARKTAAVVSDAHAMLGPTVFQRCLLFLDPGLQEYGQIAPLFLLQIERPEVFHRDI